MEIPQKIIKMACNKICNNFAKKKNKNTPKFKKINTQYEYAEFIKEEGKGNYSKGLIKVCNELVSYRIMLQNEDAQKSMARKAALNITDKFLSDMYEIDPAFVKNGMGNLPAMVNLFFEGKYCPEILVSKPKKEGDGS